MTQLKLTITQKEYETFLQQCNKLLLHCTMQEVEMQNYVIQHPYNTGKDVVNLYMGNIQKKH